ncbi:MAG: hypothetical protein AAF657_17410 [Acidobacteriota bacterium]
MQPFQSNRSALGLATFALFASGVASADPLQYFIDDPKVVVGGTELGADPGFTFDFDVDRMTYLNVQPVKVGNTFYLWTQTSWDTAGCRMGPPSGDNVLVFESIEADGEFLPRGHHGGPISQADLRQAMVTGDDAHNCQPGHYWGVGDVVPFNHSYLATFDLARSSEFIDFVKWELRLARSDGADLTSEPITFAHTVPCGIEPLGQEYACLPPTTGPNRILIEPVPHVIDEHRVGMIYQHCLADAAEGTYTDCHRNHLIVEFQDFDADPTLMTVRVRDQAGVYRTLDPATNYRIDFEQGSIPGSEPLNRILNIRGEWVAFYRGFNTVLDPGFCANVPAEGQPYGTAVQGSEPWYARFTLNADGTFKQWLSQTEQPFFDYSLKVPSRDGAIGFTYPTPLRDGVDWHFYNVQDTECRANFLGNDLIHRTMDSDTFDTFSLQTSRLAGQTVESANAIWRGNENLRSGNGRAKGRGVDEWMIGQVEIDPRKIIFLQARMRQKAPGVQFLGFSSYAEAPFIDPPAPHLGEPEHESTYFRYQRNGEWALYARRGAAVYFLASGDAPADWVAGSPNTFRMTWIDELNQIQVERGSDLVAQAVLPFEPILRFAGFQGRDNVDGIYLGTDGWVDDFSLQERDDLGVVILP